MAACRYYTSIEGSLGTAFVHCVEHALKQVQQQPLAWQPLDEDVRRILLARFPYGLYYTVEEDTLLVVSISHMKRLPGHWRELVGGKDDGGPLAGPQD